MPGKALKLTPWCAVPYLFWNAFCQTADDRETLLCYQAPRGIYVNGKEIFRGMRPPVAGIRDAIEKELPGKKSTWFQGDVAHRGKTRR